MGNYLLFTSEELAASDLGYFMAILWFWVGRDSQGSLCPTPGHAQDTKNHIRCLRALPKLWQSWCYNLFPGETVPVPSHSLLEEAFPNTQPKPPLTWPHAVPCSLVTDQRGDQCQSLPLPFLSKLQITRRSPSFASWTESNLSHFPHGFHFRPFTIIRDLRKLWQLQESKIKQKVGVGKPGEPLPQVSQELIKVYS